MRKNYLDNIRWIVIILVVIFHIFFYYNNIGIEAMFAGAPDYPGNITFAGIFQYWVYPWFMVLLFIVAGISARHALQKLTTKQFLKARVDKLLVPSTLGILAFGWIGGYMIFLNNVKPNMTPETPAFIGIFISLASGTGALWFCQLLFVASLLLVFVRFLIRKFHASDDKICAWFVKCMSKPVGFVLFLVAFYLILWGASHILNMPVVTSYRNGIYISAFFLGYYVFSNNEIIASLKKAILPLGILSILSCIFYIWRCYGLAYSDTKVLARWDLNLYAYCMILFVLSAGARFLDFRNSFTDYMQKISFGIYVFHIPVMLVTNFLLKGINLPIFVIYLIELVVALIVSWGLTELVRRIPIYRYWTLGIRTKKRGIDYAKNR